MLLYFQANFDNLIVIDAVNSSVFDYHHNKHLWCIHATHANNKKDSVQNNNMNWISAHELNWTYTMYMLNINADQQIVISDNAHNMFSILKIRYRAYADHI